MRKREKLKVGEKVVVVSNHKFIQSIDIVRDYQVVRANNSSAYLVEVADLNEAKPYTIKVSQKDFRGAGVIDSYKVYRTKEDYEKAIADREELAKLQSKIRENVKMMNLTELRGLYAFMNKN